MQTIQSLGEFAGVLPIYAANVPNNPDPRDRAWYTMPLATRADEALAARSLREVVDALVALGETLARLHNLKHFHRDIKPANLYRRDGQWELADFGLVGVPDAEAITEQGRQLGPRNFLPYELVISPDTADGGPVDVYELAKMLWVLAAGVTYAPLGHQRADSDAYTLERLLDHPLANELDRIVDQATRTDPSQRHTMPELVRELQAWLLLDDRRNEERNPQIGEVAARLRRQFGPDLATGADRERQLQVGRQRINAVQSGLRELENELRDALPGAVESQPYHQTLRAQLGSFADIEDIEQRFQGVYVIVVRLRTGPANPEVVLGVVGELLDDGRLGLRAGVCLDRPGIDWCEAELLLARAEVADTTACAEAVGAVVDAHERPHQRGSGA